MARYLQMVDQLRKDVDNFLATNVPEDVRTAAAVQLGHIINKTVRCSPRGVQHTVRKNIVAGAVGNHCLVTMTQESDDQGRTYHLIHINAKS